MELYKYLDRVDSPEDLKRLSKSELPGLCTDVRHFLLEALSKNPGHLGASLGAVELTVALHYVLDSPQDRIVWDVGHQAYTHKILTGRKKLFDTLRKWEGLSGFIHPDESEHDAFVAGHASNAISAALGIAVADQISGIERQVVAVIGDGAMTGGLTFEGLNNACTHPNNLLIILNDNNISIDPVTGGLSRYLMRINTSKTYNRLRHMGYRELSRLNLINDRRRSALLRFNNNLKAMLSDEHNFFEGFSIRYFGPYDGHDVIRMVDTLNAIKDFEGPKLLHVRTIKGKGYKPAEESAVVWHAPGCFDVHSGKRIVEHAQPSSPAKFQDVFGLTLLDIADQDERIVGITPAMVSGSSMTYMMEKYPQRTFDVGIAEEHAVTFSAGLAMQGEVIPFCVIYSSFIQRAYDQVIHDVAMQHAPVIICIDRAGLVGEDGMTHQGVYDIPSMRCVPGLTLMSPIDELELRQMMYTAYRHHKEGPFVIRYPRGKGSNPDWRTDFEELPIGKAAELRRGKEVVVVSYGPIGQDVAVAIDSLVEKGITPGHVNLRFVAPLDEGLLLELPKRYRHIVTVEDGAISGGMGSALIELFSDHGVAVSIHRVGVPNKFIKQGQVTIQRKECGLDSKSIATQVQALYQRSTSEQ